ncbi:MAG: ATP-binding protein [Candidatus Paceibacteria bacterium]
MNFVNRREELRQLNEPKEKNKSNLVVIYGKRRVGKTELIKQFIKGKNSIYYLADKRPEKEQLQNISEKIADRFKDEFLLNSGVESWLDLFSYLKQNLKEPLVLAIDEFPYLVENNSALPSVFQKGWDEYLQDLPIYLILCGSSISMMEQKILAKKSPLYGRRTGQLLLHPFSFCQLREFWPEVDFADFLQFYSITGGTPTYLLQLERELSVEKNVEKYILDRNSLLFREPEFVLREELREPRKYMSILHAIAYGNTKFGEIVNETEIDSSSIYPYLSKLRELRLIEKRVPATVEREEKFRRSTYHLRDNFFKFWFQFVLPYKSELELENKDLALSKFRREFKHMEAAAYEDVIQEIARNHQKSFFEFQKVGKWWNGDNELDLLAFNSEENKILFGEAKWREKAVGRVNLNKLKRTSEKVDWGDDQTEKYFALFSKSGFTQDLKQEVESSDLNIVLFNRDKVV